MSNSQPLINIVAERALSVKSFMYL